MGTRAIAGRETALRLEGDGLVGVREGKIAIDRAAPPAEGPEGLGGDGGLGNGAIETHDDRSIEGILERPGDRFDRHEGV